MTIPFRFRATALALSVAVAACGGDGDGDPTVSDVALRFSDAPVEDLDQVVVKVDSITFRRANGEDIVVERFTSEELGIVDAESFTIDLLDVQGEDSRLVLDSVELPVGDYADLRLGIADEDLNDSYVVESATSALKPIKVPSDELKLGAFEVSPVSAQAFVVEFGLRQSMTYNPGPDRYILKPRGVRIVALEEAAAVVGAIDLAALHAQEPCNAKPDPSLGNAVYLYAGTGLDAAALADDFDPELAGDDAEGRIAPVASAVVGADGAFVLSYLEPGAYTLAATCAAEGDTLEAIEDVAVPQPANQLVELSLERGERQRCSFGTETPSCAADPVDATPDGGEDVEDEETEDDVETDEVEDAG